MNAQSTKAHGFTLVETLVALTIFSVVGLTAFALLSRALAARAAVKRATDELLQRRQAANFIRTDLSGAQSFALAPFQGSTDSLCFSRVVKLTDGSTVLRRVTYFVRPDSTRQSLQLLRVLDDFHGDEKIKLLFAGLAAMQLSYWRQEKDGGRWVETWPASGALPQAVRVQLTRQSDQKPLQLICPIRAYDKTMAN